MILLLKASLVHVVTNDAFYKHEGKEKTSKVTSLMT